LDRWYNNDGNVVHRTYTSKPGHINVSVLMDVVNCGCGFFFLWCKLWMWMN